MAGNPVVAHRSPALARDIRSAPGRGTGSLRQGHQGLFPDALSHLGTPSSYNTTPTT